MAQVSDERTVRPMTVANEEGEARWWLGALAIIKATAAETGGDLTIVDVTDPLVSKRRYMFITVNTKPSGSSTGA